MTSLPATILVVDDEAQNRKVLETLLRPEGHVVLSAASGEEALVLAAARRPDLILLDVMMPGMDGHQVARTLKADPATSNIPVIMVTALDARGARLAGLEAGAEDFLTKPVDRGELWLRVRNLLRLKKLGDLLADHNRNLEREVQARAAELQLFRNSLDATVDGIFLVSRDTLRFVEINATACAMLGYTREEMMARGPAQMVGEEAGRLEGAYDALIAGDGADGLVELAFRRKDGSAFPAEVRRHAHRTGSGWIIVEVARDITERRRAQAEALGHVAQLKAALMTTVEMVTTISEMRDPYTAGHERRVAEIATAIGAELGFDEHRLEGLRVGGWLHDVGKMTIPAELLAKPGRLSPIELLLIKGHAQASYDVLKGVAFPWPVAQMALQHHERLDGSGYPQGLKGADMLLEARILAVADVVEAMASHRPYRPAVGLVAALGEIERGRGKTFDTDAADACLRLFREKGYAIPA